MDQSGHSNTKRAPKNSVKVCERLFFKYINTKHKRHIDHIDRRNVYWEIIEPY